LEYNNRTYKKIDSIRKNYGINIDNTGCQVELIEKEGQIKYEEMVIPYLEKRNDKGWEKRMRNEIEIIKELAPKKIIKKRFLFETISLEKSLEMIKIIGSKIGNKGKKILNFRSKTLHNYPPRNF
jgi:hypothetical protein